MAETGLGIGPVQRLRTALVIIVCSLLWGSIVANSQSVRYSCLCCFWGHQLIRESVKLCNVLQQNWVLKTIKSVHCGLCACFLRIFDGLHAFPTCGELNCRSFSCSSPPMSQSAFVLRTSDFFILSWESRKYMQQFTGRGGNINWNTVYKANFSTNPESHPFIETFLMTLRWTN